MITREADPASTIAGARTEAKYYPGPSFFDAPWIFRKLMSASNIQDVVVAHSPVIDILGH